MRAMRRGHQVADGDPHDVVHGQIGEDGHVPVAVADDPRPLGPDPQDDAAFDLLDLQSRFFAPGRRPAGIRPAPRGRPDRPRYRMPIAELLDPAVVLRRIEVGLGPVARDRVFDVGRMRGHGVIAVHAVFLHELPIGLDAVFLRAVDDLHPVLALVGDVREEGFRFGQVVVERCDVRIEADEDEPAVFLAPRDFPHVEQRIGFVAREHRVADRDVGEFARGVEHPAVVAAAEDAGRAGVLLADHGPAVRTAVVKRPDCPPAVAHQDQRAPVDATGDEGAGLRDFRSVADVEPYPVVDQLALHREDVGIREDPPADAERPARSVLDHQAVDEPAVGCGQGHPAIPQAIAIMVRPLYKLARQSTGGPRYGPTRVRAAGPRYPTRTSSARSRAQGSDRALCAPVRRR